MFIKFHKLREDRDEQGFTLIELLVVILIIAILAAIAIPVFLRQREKGWVSQMESALKNAATAEESYATGDGNGSYTADLALLQAEGFKYADTVTPVPTVSTDASVYCVSVTHGNLSGVTYAISTEQTAPVEGTCSAGVYVAPTTTP